MILKMPCNTCNGVQEFVSDSLTSISIMVKIWQSDVGVCRECWKKGWRKNEHSVDHHDPLELRNVKR